VKKKHQRKAKNSSDLPYISGRKKRKKKNKKREIDGAENIGNNTFI
jgi:hypothetical protein